MNYLKAFKYPLRYMVDDLDLEGDMLFIEHIAEQSISVAKAGMRVTPDVYNMLDRAGVTLIKAASLGAVTDEQARVFEKIMSAVQLNVPNSPTQDALILTGSFEE